MNANQAWYRLFNRVKVEGREVAPRGRPTLELPHATVAVDLRFPVVTVRPGLSDRFRAAEALWIIEGRDDLEPLASIVPRMAEFSDDGRTLAGAYGPPIALQLPYVVQKLREDRNTRQAVLTIWRPNPMPSKDIPCTVAMAFQVREDRLNVHVFMRSSDVWLGLPYDLFSFAMVAEWVRLHYNFIHGIAGNRAASGTLYVTAASSHLYADDLAFVDPVFPVHAPMPDWMHPGELREYLAQLALSSSERTIDKWWLV